MSRRSPQPRSVAKPEAELNAAAAEAEVTSRPKYNPVPDFGIVVLESRHGTQWPGPPWFEEAINKFLLVVSGGTQLRTPEKAYCLNQDSLDALPGEEPPGKPIVNRPKHQDTTGCRCYK